MIKRETCVNLVASARMEQLIPMLSNVLQEHTPQVLEIVKCPIVWIALQDSTVLWQEQSCQLCNAKQGSTVWENLSQHLLLME